MDAALDERPTRPRRCRFVVTGFGPFAGVPDNPTSVLVRRLREATREEDGRPAVQVGNITETHILETSAGHVREKIEEFYEQLRSEVAGDSSKDKGCPDKEVDTVIFLHLGVNYKGTQFQLEECAYNDATFRVADERGYQPKGECIHESSNSTEDKSSDWGKCLTTTLDVHDLCRELQKHGEAVMVSRDPGRFVCNFTYCLSLDRCQSTNNMRGGGDRGMQQTPGGPIAYSLFVHVPPFDVVPEGRQFDFVLRVMEAIEQQLSV